MYAECGHRLLTLGVRRSRQPLLARVEPWTRACVQWCCSSLPASVKWYPTLDCSSKVVGPHGGLHEDGLAWCLRATEQLR